MGVHAGSPCTPCSSSFLRAKATRECEVGLHQRLLGPAGGVELEICFLGSRCLLYPGKWGAQS